MNTELLKQNLHIENHDNYMRYMMGSGMHVIVLYGESILARLEKNIFGSAEIQREEYKNFIKEYPAFRNSMKFMRNQMKDTTNQKKKDFVKTRTLSKVKKVKNPIVQKTIDAALAKRMWYIKNNTRTPLPPLKKP